MSAPRGATPRSIAILAPAEGVQHQRGRYLRRNVHDYQTVRRFARDAPQRLELVDNVNGREFSPRDDSCHQALRGAHDLTQPQSFIPGPRVGSDHVAGGDSVRTCRSCVDAELAFTDLDCIQLLHVERRVTVLIALQRDTFDAMSFRASRVLMPMSLFVR